MANDQASDFLENALVNHILRNVTYTPATTCAVALFTTTPTDVANSGAEVHTSGGYARQSGSFGPALTGSTGNINTLTFGPASLPWGVITAFAIFDNITSGSGNMLIWGPLNSTVTINASDSAQFASGTLQVSVL